MYTRQASDVSALPKVPDVHFDIDHGKFIADVDGFFCEIERLTETRSRVRIQLDGKPYCACEHICSESPHFPGESLEEQVTGFACGLIWSAWRRRELARLESRSESK